MTASRNFFARFNIPLKSPDRVEGRNVYADFTTGRPTNYSLPNSEELAAAMARLEPEWFKYENMMLPTSWNFPAGHSIPEDLLLTWNEFARKYNVEAVTSTIWNNVAIVSDTALMIDMWKVFDPSVLRGVMLPVSNDNSEIFDKISQLLGKDVMYKSQVISSKRTNKGVRLQVKSADNGRITTINAKRLLITIGNDIIDREAFDLDSNEDELLHSTTGNRQWAGLISHPSLEGYLITNSLAAAAAPSPNHLILPGIPFLQAFEYFGNSSTGPVYRTIIGTSMDSNIEDAKNVVRTALQKLMDAGTVPAGDVNQIDFKELHDHGMMFRRWSKEQLRNDIVRRTNALQGLRSTWYTGASWSVHNAAMLWNATDIILPKMLQGI
ncbi:hypothetical protein J1614_012108 [Plenodomus biglobosus]|nr:hypothetical protein J1614_012108 [Plenodomus biglobosus]